MRFALLVNAAADSAAALTALHTAQALLGHSDHQLYRLFFYRDAVHLAHRHAWSADGAQANAAQQWQQWLADNPLDAVVCVGVQVLFRSWADALIHSDRVIQFG